MTTKEVKIKYWKAHLSKKLFFIIHYGGKCQECNTDLTNHPSKATFHHRDMSKKDLEPRHAIKLYYEEALKELDKCDLLCHNCHSEKHFNIDSWLKNKEEIINNSKKVPETSQEKNVINPDKIKKYHSRGLSVSKISRLTEYSIPSIYACLEKLSLQPNIDVPKRNFTEEEFSKMKEMRSKGNSYERISKIMGCSKQGVMYYKEKINQ